MAAKTILYFVALAVPLTISAVVGYEADDPLSVVTALWFGLTGITIMSLQFVLASRSRWIERGIGLDAILRFHRTMAIWAVALLAAHPVLIAAGFGRWELLTTSRQSPPVLVGKTALVLLLILAATSLYRIALRIEFEWWRRIHNLLAATALAFGCYHAWYVGQAREFPAFRVLPAALLVVAATAYIYAKVIAPRRASRSPYKVVSVTPEAGRVRTIVLAPTGRRIEPNAPGQFAFIRFLPGSGIIGEEHPFTIASAPSESGCLEFSIKDSGDFSSLTRNVRPGDLAAVQGPFGVFSNAFRPEEKNLVFIAGGIGITPLMSMIRGMHASRSDAEVLLIYGNETEDEIVFREELDEMSKSGHPKLRVVHVVNHPGDDWHGARGFITRDLVAQECGELAAKSFYVCGPVVMMNKVRGFLRDLGVPRRSIHWERFSL